MAHWTMLKPGVPIDLTRHQYLVDIYRCAAGRLVIFKAGQMGASEYTASYALHAAVAATRPLEVRSRLLPTCKEPVLQRWHYRPGCRMPGPA